MKNLKQLLLKSFILSAIFLFISCSNDDSKVSNNSNVEVVEDEEELSELMIYLRDK